MHERHVSRIGRRLRAGLRGLERILEKAEAHARALGEAPERLLDAKLAGDMHDLAAQAHWVIEGASLATRRVLDRAAAPNGEPRRTFAAIRGHLEATKDALLAIDPLAWEARRGASIELPIGGASRTFTSEAFLAEFAIPSLYFHLATAYAILRQAGVPLQKGDFLVL